MKKLIVILLMFLCLTSYFGNANTDCGNIRGAQNVNSVNIRNGSWFNNIIEKIFD